MATPAEWSRGFARQADADFRLFQTLEPQPAVAACHKFLLLQVACEKLVKAHLCGSGTNPADVQSSHAYVAASLPVVLRQTAVAVNVTGPQAKWVLQHARHLAGGDRRSRPGGQAGREPAGQL